MSEAPLYVIVSEDSPIAANESVTLTDLANETWILFERKAHPGMQRSTFDTAADGTIVIGLIAAAGAVVTGLDDWSTVEEQAAKRIGAVHGLLNNPCGRLVRWFAHGAKTGLPRHR